MSLDQRVDVSELFRPSPVGGNLSDDVCSTDLTVRRFSAVVDGEIAGTVMGGYDGHRGWIYTLAVHPEVRRRGVGTALLRHLERILIDRGCGKINLQVMPGNDSAVAFYERLGYRVEPRVSMGRIVDVPPAS